MFVDMVSLDSKLDVSSLGEVSENTRSFLLRVYKIMRIIMTSAITSIIKTISNV